MDNRDVHSARVGARYGQVEQSKQSRENMMKTILASLAAALVWSGGAFAIGAIAVDDQEGDTEPGYGFALEHDTKEQAQRAAMAECRKAGNKNCKVAVWFETCGAYAASKRYYGVGWGKTAARARDMALEKCGNSSCRIKIAKCED